MKPIELKSNLEQEIYFPVNVLFVLSDMQKENPYEYNVIQGFVETLKKEREKIDERYNKRNNKNNTRIK